MGIRNTRSCIAYKEISKCHTGSETQENCTKGNSYTMNNFAEELILLKNYLSAQMECLYTKLVYSLFKTEHLPISECTYVNAN